MKMVRMLALVVLAALAAYGAPAQEPEVASRVWDGLLLCYTFADDGEIVIDEVTSDQPMDLLIETPDAARIEDGALVITGNAMVASPSPAEVLPATIRECHEITIEAWVHPSSLEHEGPARIVTLSLDSGQRNFTFGQEKDRYIVRLRTTTTGAQGTPELVAPAGSVVTELTHVVFTHAIDGSECMYLNGELVAEGARSGDMSNWEDTMRLALGNELTADRTWMGSLSLVAVYGRPLTAEQVLANFQAGPDADL